MIKRYPLSETLKIEMCHFDLVDILDDRIEVGSSFKVNHEK